MRVEKMDLSKLKVGPPAWLRPTTPEDWLSESLEELRAELRNGLDRFRAECAPRVGPEVTCRGVVVSEPAIVPVDPGAYQRHQLDLLAKALEHVALEFGAAFESLERLLRNTYGGEL